MHKIIFSLIFGVLLLGSLGLTQFVFAGVEQVPVPDVIGLPIGDALDAILEASLLPGTLTDVYDASPSGTVIGQNPTGGDMADVGSSVDFTVSLGPATVPIPDVVGLSQANAETAIITAGLTVGTVSTANSDTVPAGDVIDQTPSFPADVSPGSSVDFTVSLGPTLFRILPSDNAISFSQIDYQLDSGFFPNSDALLISIDNSKVAEIFPDSDFAFVSVSSPDSEIVENIPILFSPFGQDVTNYVFQFGNNGEDVPSMEEICVEASPDLIITPTCEDAPDTFSVSDFTEVIGGCFGDPVISPVSPSFSGTLPFFDPFGVTSLNPSQQGHVNLEAANYQCHPMAIANSLQFLENNNSELNILPPHTIGLKGDPVLVSTLESPSYINRDVPNAPDRRAPASGVEEVQGLSGKLKFLIDFGLDDEIKTTHSGVKVGDDVQVTRNNTVLTSKSLGTEVTFESIKNAVDAGADVEIGWTSPAGKHMEVVIDAFLIFGVPYIVTMSDVDQSDDTKGAGQAGIRQWFLNDHDGDKLLNLGGTDREITFLMIEEFGDFVPTLAVNTPTTGETTNDIVTVSGVAGVGDVVAILIDGFVVEEVIIESDRTWTFTSDFLSEGPHRITTKVLPGTSNNPIASLEIPIIVDSIPKVTILSPSDGDEIATSSIISFEASATDEQDDDTVLESGIIWSINGVPEPSSNDGPKFDKSLDPGNYEIIAFVEDSDGNSAEHTINIKVLSGEEPTAVIFARTAEIVDKYMTFFGLDSTDPKGGELSYFWDFGDGTTGTGELTNKSYDHSGTFTVTLTVTNPEGLTDSTSVDVNIFPIISGPTAVINAPTNGVINQILTFDGSGSTDDGDIVEYNWFLRTPRNGPFTHIGSGEFLFYSFVEKDHTELFLTVVDNDGLVDTTSQFIFIISDKEKKKTYNITGTLTCDGDSITGSFSVKDKDGGLIYTKECNGPEIITIDFDVTTKSKTLETETTCENETGMNKSTDKIKLSEKEIKPGDSLEECTPDKIESVIPELTEIIPIG